MTDRWMDLQTERGQTEGSDFIGLTIKTKKMDGNDLSSGQYSVNKNIRFTTYVYVVIFMFRFKIYVSIVMHILL